MKFTLVCLCFIILTILGTNSTSTQLQDGGFFQTSQKGREKRQTYAYTGYKAIPRNTVTNRLYNADGTGSPVFKYKRGFNGRIEFLEGIIKKNNIGRGTPCNTATRTFILQRTTLATDVCGHIIAKVLGGSGRVEYNVFPQDSRLNNRDWKRYEGVVKRFVKTGENRVANVRFWFDYDTPDSTRPTHFTVTYNLLEGNDIIESNSFEVWNAEVQGD